MLQRVAAIAIPGVSPFELGLVCEVFGIDRTDTGCPSFDLVVCTPEPGLLPMKTGLSVQVDAGLEATEQADLVIMLPYGDTRALAPQLLSALRAAHDRGSWVMSICTGAFALGEAGLLDGRRCATHWLHAAELAAQFPMAQVDPAVLYVEDDGVLTSAGTAAGIDTCLHLVRTELGAEAAAGIARRMVVPPHRDGNQLQYVDTPLPCDANTLAPLLAWMSTHLADDLTVPQLAARALMSPRTFARRFRAETGTTPAAWLTRQRLARAQELLERTDTRVDEIARFVGFGTAAVLRHHFSRVLGTTPQSYRRQFTCAEPADRVA